MHEWLVVWQRRSRQGGLRARRRSRDLRSRRWRSTGPPAG